MAKLPKYKVPEDPARPWTKKRFFRTLRIVLAVLTLMLMLATVALYIYCDCKTRDLPYDFQCDDLYLSENRQYNCCIKKEYEMNKDLYWPSYWIPITGHGIDRNCEQYLK
jgi:hypothetical protein